MNQKLENVYQYPQYQLTFINELLRTKFVRTVADAVLVLRREFPYIDAEIRAKVALPPDFEGEGWPIGFEPFLKRQRRLQLALDYEIYC